MGILRKKSGFRGEKSWNSLGKNENSEGGKVRILWGKKDMVLWGKKGYSER